MKHPFYLAIAALLLAAPGYAATASRFTTIVTVEEALEGFRKEAAEAESYGPNAADAGAIEKKLQDCGAALAGEVRAEDDVYDFRPSSPLPEVCHRVANEEVTRWFGNTIRLVRYSKLMKKLEERSFKWKAFSNSVAADVSYDPMFNPEMLIPARYDTLPPDEQLIVDLKRIDQKFHVVAHDKAAVKAFYGHSRYKDYEKQKAYLLKNHKALAKILLAETEITTESSGHSGKWAILILVDKELQAVATELIILVQ